jgi:hypothetical protein
MAMANFAPMSETGMVDPSMLINTTGNCRYIGTVAESLQFSDLPCEKIAA